MAFKRKQTDWQPDLWIPTAGLAKSPVHPVYERLNLLLRRQGFDRWVETLCESCYASGRRGSIQPGVYFRMLFIGYFEGIPSNRQIEWRCQDSLSLKEFLGLSLEERTFQNLYVRYGRQRRTTLRGTDKVLTDYLMKAAAFNLGLLLRVCFGHGTPMAMAKRPKWSLFALYRVKIRRLGLWKGLHGLEGRVRIIFASESRQSGLSTIYAA